MLYLMHSLLTGVILSNKSNMLTKAVGIALAVIGAGIAIYGYQLSGSVGAQLTEADTVSLTDKVMFYYIAGAASIAVGLCLLTRHRSSIYVMAIGALVLTRYYCRDQFMPIR